MVSRLEAVPRPTNNATDIDIGHLDAHPGFLQSSSPRMPSASQVQMLEQRCEASDEALAQSQHREEMLREMLDEAKASLQNLGEEADHECQELQLELQMKTAELDVTFDELSSATKAADSNFAATPVAVNGELLVVEELRAALARSQAENAAFVRSDLAMKAECAELTEHVRRFGEHAAKDSMQPSRAAASDAAHWQAERDMLREEVGDLKSEARAMWESQDEVWRLHTVSKDRLVADVAQLRRLLADNACPNGAGSDVSGVTAAAAAAARVSAIRKGANIPAAEVPSLGSHRGPGITSEAPHGQPRLVSDQAH